MKHLFILSALLVTGYQSSIAQGGYTSMHYDIAFGMAGTKDFISKPSFRGVGFDYRAMASDNVGVGVSLGWQTFYERKENAVYSPPDGTGTISGTQFRYLNAFPIHIATNYYFGTADSDVRPFVGLGVGAFFSERQTQMGIYVSTTNSWQFSLAPEVGVMYKLQSRTSLIATAKYTSPFKNTTFDSQPYIGISVGAAWNFH